MAYKDEYEVARLYSDGRFAKYRAETFKGGKAKVWLSPPLLARKGPDGKPVKMAFSPWMLDLAFPTLAKLKGLRGGALDIFGMTAERKMERGLLADFEADLDKIAAGLSKARHHVAVKLAQVPQQIRGYGHVKDASVGPAKAEAKRHWKDWEKVAAPEAVEA
jgi:indolepyruvate ferredoxin oxidoreductase